MMDSSTNLARIQRENMDELNIRTALKFFARECQKVSCLDNETPEYWIEKATAMETTIDNLNAGRTVITAVDLDPVKD